MRSRETPTVFGLLIALLVASVPLAAADAAYRVVPGWPALPDGWSLGEAAGVGVDSHNHIFVFHRGDERPIVRLSAATGEIEASFGDGIFGRAHGLEVDSQDNVWVTDVVNHQVYKFSHDGELLLTVGEKGKAGWDATHFDQPTDLVVTRDGELYVSDGYGNSRVAKFAADGSFLLEWGKPGSEPGQFDLPHGIAIDPEGRIYVADRSNLRIQIFDGDGKLEAVWKSDTIGRPWGLEVAPDGHLYVIDGGDMLPQPPHRARLLKLRLDGEVVDSWSAYGHEAGELAWGHDVAVGRDGAVYTVEVRHNLRAQKFVP